MPDALDALDARLMLDEGRPDAAVRLTSVALDRSPDNWRLRCVGADARMATDDAAGAAAHAAEAVVLAPREAAPKAALGSAMLMLGHAEDASACLADALACDPGHIGYRLALSRALMLLGNTDTAAEVLAQGVAMRPRVPALRTAAIRLAISQRDFATALLLADAARAEGVVDACILGLRGHALSCLDRDTEAVTAYAEALQLAPEDPYVRHLVAAAGLVATPVRASADYVRVLFDGFARHFDSNLIGLGYRVPGLIRAVVQHQYAASPSDPDGMRRIGAVLDLGCGTGLIGLVLADLPIGELTGIDLSAAMLAEAAAKSLYVTLIKGDICTDDLAALGQFALAVAGDVMPYLGEPRPLLDAVFDRLEPGGRFVLTIESLAVGDVAAFRLGRRARYAHCPDAVQRTAIDAGFAVTYCVPEILRLDRGEPVAGYVLVLQRPAPSPRDLT
jgi:predicted TPR repeat methyltransferase